MLARLRKRQRVLLIADDIQYFDNKTLELLEQLLDPRPLERDANYKDLSLLAELNENARPPPSLTASRVNELTATVNAVELDYCSQQTFGGIKMSWIDDYPTAAHFAATLRLQRWSSSHR